MFDIITVVLPYGKRLALSGGTVTLRVYRNPFMGIRRKEGNAMLTIEGLLAVLSFGLACFGIGFAIGRDDNNNSQK